MEPFVSNNLELDGEYVLVIDSDGFLKLLECGTIEEIEEGNLMEFDFPIRIKGIEVFNDGG